MGHSEGEIDIPLDLNTNVTGIIDYRNMNDKLIRDEEIDRFAIQLATDYRLTTLPTRN